MASSQHRCVFVGNIPYDASEEQLIEICKEVGPVVSFRLVIDRETGKPKGYGFCEYKDEETALSARRNLQGYEINGRQLRVDFAENDKGVDRSRDQGRGGPGLAANVDPQKQMVGPAMHAESVLHQPLGLPSALSAATVMAGALGGGLAGMQTNQNGLPSQSALANDPLTLHLAKMSRSQMNEILSEMKGMATQDKELARQLLLARPQLSKALFQAQIMLGMVTPQMLHLPNIRQTPGQVSQPLLQEGQSQQQMVQSLPGLPPLAQSKIQAGLMPQGPVSVVSQNLLGHNQLFAPQQHPMQPRVQLQQQANNQALRQATLPGQSGASAMNSLGNLSARPQIQAATSSSLNQQVQPRLAQHSGQVGVVNLGHTPQMVFPNANIQPSHLPRPSSSDAGYQLGPSRTSITETIHQDTDRSVQVTDAHRNNTQSKMPFGLVEKRSMVHDSSEPFNRPSKLVKLDDGRGNFSSVSSSNVSNATGSRPPHNFGVGSLSVNPVPKAEGVQFSENKMSQAQLPPEVESALLQQVMNLTPEQLSSLPPEQQQQVIQLQRAFRRDHIQPS